MEGLKMKAKLIRLIDMLGIYKYSCSCNFRSNSPSAAMAHYAGYAIHNIPLAFEEGNKIREKAEQQWAK